MNSEKLSHYCTILTGVLTPAGIQPKDSTIELTVFSFADGLTRELIKKNNFPKESSEKVGNILSTIIYTTSLCIGIPKNNYNDKTAQIVFSSSALLQYYKKADRLISLLPLYLNTIISITNETIQKKRDIQYYLYD